MKKPNRLSSINNLNKELTYMGLTPTQWLLLSLSILVLFAALRLYFIVIVPVILYGALKLEKEQKKGNPDFLNSNKKFKLLKKSYIDSRNLFKYL